MKRFLISFAEVVLFTALLMLGGSCSKGEDKVGDSVSNCADNSLAGSVIFTIARIYRIVDSSIVYDGDSIIAPNSYSHLLCPIGKVSDSVIYINTASKLGVLENMGLEVYIPRVELGGEPHNVTFDYLSNDSRLLLDDREFDSVELHVKGSLKTSIYDIWPLCHEDGVDVSVGSRRIICDIDIRGEVNGKELIFKIDSISSDW